MGGPEMAPQTPQRSERPGEPGPLLDHPNPQTPQRSERPGEPGPLLDDRDSFTSSGPPPQSRAAVRHGGHNVVGAALEGARDTAVGLAAVLRRLHLVARQLAVGDDADRAGDTHPIRALAFFDAHHGRVRLQLRHEIPEKRVGVHRLLLRSSESGRRTATRVPPSVARALTIALGFGVVALLLRRWTRRRRAAPAPPPVDAAMSERIRRELETDR